MTSAAQSKPRKLDAGQRHVLKIIERDKNAEGWTSVSKVLYPSLVASIPKQLAIFEQKDSGFRAKLTDEGRSLLRAMEWL